MIWFLNSVVVKIIFIFQVILNFFINVDLICNHEGTGREFKEAPDMEDFKFPCDWTQTVRQSPSIGRGRNVNGLQVQLSLQLAYPSKLRLPPTRQQLLVAAQSADALITTGNQKCLWKVQHLRFLCTVLTEPESFTQHSWSGCSSVLTGSSDSESTEGFGNCLLPWGLPVSLWPQVF